MRVLSFLLYRLVGLFVSRFLISLAASSEGCRLPHLGCKIITRVSLPFFSATTFQPPAFN